MLLEDGHLSGMGVLMKSLACMFTGEPGNSTGRTAPLWAGCSWC